MNKKALLKTNRVMAPIVLFFIVPMIYLVSRGFWGILPDIMGKIHSFLYHPIDWLTLLNGSESQSNPTHYFSIVALTALYIFVFIGIIYSFTSLYFYATNKKRKNIDTVRSTDRHPKYRDFCTKELAEALESVEKTGVKKALITTHLIKFMSTFEYAARDIFQLEDKECRCFWILSNKENYDIITLDGEPTSKVERSIIGMGIGRNLVRVPYTDVKQQYPEFSNTQIEQFLLVRNFGNLKLAFAFTIHKKDTINNYNLQEFNMLSSYLLLLGFHENFTFRIKKLQETS